MSRVRSLILAASLTWPAVPSAEPRVQQQPLNWYAVRDSRPGDELIITTRGGRPVVRYFLQADDTTIPVLNVESPRLPWRAARAIRDLASTSPGQFERLRSPGFELQLADADLRLSSQGLYAGNRKLADFNQLVETLARDQVLSIKTAYHFPRGAAIAIAATAAALAALVILASACNGGCIGR